MIRKAKQSQQPFNPALTVFDPRGARAFKAVDHLLANGAGIVRLANGPLNVDISADQQRFRTEFAQDLADLDADSDATQWALRTAAKAMGMSLPEYEPIPQTFEEYLAKMQPAGETTVSAPVPPVSAPAQMRGQETPTEPDADTRAKMARPIRSPLGKLIHDRLMTNPPGISAREIFGILDDEEHDMEKLAPSWYARLIAKGYERPTFRDAYRDPDVRLLMDPAVAKVARRLRKRGLL